MGGVSIVRWNPKGMRGKYRIVIDGGCPNDEPVGGAARSSPHYGGEDISHLPGAPRCLRTARSGRKTREVRRTDRVSGWHRSKRAEKWKQNGERSCGGSWFVQ